MDNLEMLKTILKKAIKEECDRLEKAENIKTDQDGPRRQNLVKKSTLAGRISGFESCLAVVEHLERTCSK